MLQTCSPPLRTTAYANEPMCAPTSTTTSSGSKRSGSRYSSSATTPSKTIWSSVPGRKVHAPVTDQINRPRGAAVALVHERVAVADRVRRLPVHLGHQRQFEHRRLRERAALVRDVAPRATLT